MKTNNLIGVFLLALSAVGFAACGDKDEHHKIQPLSVYKDSYEIPVRNYGYVSIMSGNRDYNLRVENPQMLDADVDFGWSGDQPMITLYAKEKGETVLSVTDNVTLQTCDIRVKVTDNYIVYHTSPNNHPVLSRAGTVFLINNPARDAYFFRSEIVHANHAIDSRLVLEAKGSYTLVKENGKPCLTLIYATGADGYFADEAEKLTPHKFYVTKYDPVVPGILNDGLNLGWEVASQDTRTSMPPPPGMTIEEVGTDYKVEGSLERINIPEGILE